MKLAVKVPAEGTATVIDYSSEDELRSLQNQVQGYIEIINLPSGYTMIVNEEGKLMNLALNRRATEVLIANFNKTHDFIVGDALITGAIDEEGQQLGLSQEKANELVAQFNQ